MRECVVYARVCSTYVCASKYRKYFIMCLSFRKFINSYSLVGLIVQTNAVHNRHFKAPLHTMYHRNATHVGYYKPA